MTKLYTQQLGSGKPLVLIHGWAMHSGIWGNFAIELAKDFSVTCIDLPGHGHSEALNPFELRQVSDAVVKAIPEKSCCLGWSLGAAIALDIANRYPERVNSLVLCAGSPKFLQSEDKAWPGMKPEVLEAFTENLKKDCKATLVRFLSLQLSTSPDANALLKQLKAAISLAPTPSNQTLQDGLKMLQHTDLRNELASLTLPAAAILGDKDTLTPVAVAKKMHELLPALEITIIKGAGHVPFLSHEHEVLAIVKRFLNAA